MEETRPEKLIRIIRRDLGRHKRVTGYTFEQIADGSGVNRTTLIDFLSEKGTPAVRILIAIDRYLARQRDPAVRKARRTRHPARDLLRSSDETP